MRSIYLNKKNLLSNTEPWAYYTIKGGFEVGDNIEVKLVSFPDFSEIDVIVDIPGNVGLSAAYDNINLLLRNKWGIERERSELIGILEH